MRSLVRETVFKYIYSKLFNQESEGLFDVLIDKFSEEDKSFAKELLQAYIDRKDENINSLSNLSNFFTIDRIYNVDKAVILLGMAELDVFINTPTAVIIDECVTLSAKYSTENSVNYVNAILANYAKDRKNV